jgi:hypothetical protein
MTAPDLTAIVEAARSDVTQAICDHRALKSEVYSQDLVAEAVTATLLALTPMVDDWVALAKDNADIGEQAENLSEKASERGDYTEALARSADARVAYTAGHTLLSCANTLRKLIEGAK